MVWVEGVGFKQVSKIQSGEGLAFFGWGRGDRVAGLPEGTFCGWIDFQMRLPWGLFSSESFETCLVVGWKPSLLRGCG